MAEDISVALTVSIWPEIIFVIIATVLMFIFRGELQERVGVLCEKVYSYPILRYLAYVIFATIVIKAVYDIYNHFCPKEKRVFKAKYNIPFSVRKLNLGKRSKRVEENCYQRKTCMLGYRWIKIDDYIIYFYRDEEEVLTWVKKFRDCGIYIAPDKYEQTNG